jgi:hypothetical protein
LAGAFCLPLAAALKAYPTFFLSETARISAKVIFRWRAGMRH